MVDKINPANMPDYKLITLNELTKMDEASIFNKLDKDKSGTISDKELTMAGLVEENLLKAKDYLLQKFGIKKITNNTPGENYFEYSPANTKVTTAHTIDELPTRGSWIRDARGYDISNLELPETELLNLCIDNTTVLSPEQKAIIEFYTEKCKDPGLGIRTLHEQGITGKGVHMAIIDQPLGKHQEYAANIRSHTDVNATEMRWCEASMHGAAVTSIAVGKSVGVAPDATVDYYSAVNMTQDPEANKDYIEYLELSIEKESIYLDECSNDLKVKEERRIALQEKLSSGNNSRLQNELKIVEEDIRAIQEYLKAAKDNISSLQEEIEHIKKYGQSSSNSSYANAINKILDKNHTLPPDERISVISVSWGFDKHAEGYEDLVQAIARAKKEGVFVVSTALYEHYGMRTCGANRAPKGDLNSPESYEAGAFFKHNSEIRSKEYKNNLLLIPMDHRTTADYTDETSYRYEGNDGGMSWSTPWLAGMYVLAKQTDPDITPQKFWEIALNTSDECTNNDSGVYVGRIINPRELIKAVKEGKEQ